VLSEATHENLPEARRPQWIDPLFRTLILTFAAIVGTSLALIGGLIVYGSQQGPTNYRRVHAAGLDLSGLSQAEAARRIQERFDAFAAKGVVVSSGEQHWTIPLKDLGVTFDAEATEATAETAYGFGRSGSLWTDSAAWLVSLVSGYTVPSTMELDDAAVVSFLQRVAPEITSPPIDACYVFDKDGNLAVDPGAAGVGIDVPATLREVRRAVASLSFEPVAIVTADVPRTVDAEQLEPGLEKATSMVSERLVLEHRGVEWEVPTEVLRGMLLVQGGGDRSEPGVTLDSGALTTYLGSLADAVHRTGRNATPVWDDTQFIVRRSIPAETLDAAATSTAVIRALWRRGGIRSRSPSGGKRCPSVTPMRWTLPSAPSSSWCNPLRSPGLAAPPRFPSPTS
jgi:vancomycin resistance protein YoaR